MAASLMENFTIVDLETTGLSPQSDRIIEIGALVVEKGRLIRTFSSFVHPQRSIPPFIEQLTGIRSQDVREAPTFEEIAEEVEELFSGRLLVAHNARFDYGFLRNELQNLGKSFSVKCLCTARLSRMLFPGARGHSLDKVMKRLGISCKARHRALDDAKVLWEFWQKIREQFSEEKIQTVLGALLKTPTYPSALKASVVEALPKGPGVYIFYNEEGAPLYVGKSVRLRERVLSHFSSDYTQGKESALCRRTSDVEARPTAGELGALLLESHLIKKLQPWYNRRSRESRRLVVLRQRLDRKGYQRVEMERITRLQTWDLPEILGVFRNSRQAKECLLERVEEYGLCPKLLNLEKGRGKCFSAQIKKCAGACMGQEDPCLYNLRVSEAFRESRIQNWPYEGPVVLEERDPENGRGECFVVDRWCLVGKLNFDELSQNPLEMGEYVFDYESYQILRRFLREKKNRSKVKRLGATGRFRSGQITLFPVPG